MMPMRIWLELCTGLRHWINHFCLCEMSRFFGFCRIAVDLRYIVLLETEVPDVCQADLQDMNQQMLRNRRSRLETGSAFWLAAAKSALRDLDINLEELGKKDVG